MTVSGCWKKPAGEQSVLMIESFLCLCWRRRYANGPHTSPDGVCLCPWPLHRWGQQTVWSVDRKGTFACSLFPVVLMITPNTSHDFGEVYKTGLEKEIAVLCCRCLSAVKFWMHFSVSTFSLWKKNASDHICCQIYYHFEDIKVLCLARLWLRIWRLNMSYLLSKFLYIFCDVKASENLHNVKYWQSCLNG